MDGIHDMGGMLGFGPVPTQANDVFRHHWQKRAFALAETLSWSVPFNSDQHRHAIERIPPSDYLSLDYFEKWEIGCRTLLLEAGLVDEIEIETGKKRFDLPPEKQVAVGAVALVAATRAGASMSYPDHAVPPTFAQGQTVRVSNASPTGHTRAPRYVRGHMGVIDTRLGAFQFADAMALGAGPAPQQCYTVRFDASDLWAPDAELGTSVCLDLWEAYLEPA